MKHVGKMKNNGARVVIAYRTIPGDPLSALVVGTQQLQDSYHDSLMSLVESDAGQQADELADVMAVRRFPDGSNMLQFVHTNGMMTKVATNAVLVTPDNKTSIPLDELNNIIATQKGVPLEQLAVKDGSNSTIPTIGEKTTSESDHTNEVVIEETAKAGIELTPAEMRSRADALYKEAAKLRKEADEIDPPKSKKAVKETA
jgi:hypothetical protein